MSRKYRQNVLPFFPMGCSFSILASLLMIGRENVRAAFYLVVGCLVGLRGKYNGRHCAFIYFTAPFLKNPGATDSNFRYPPKGTGERRYFI